MNKNIINYNYFVESQSIQGELGTEQQKNERTTE